MVAHYVIFVFVSFRRSQAGAKIPKRVARSRRFARTEILGGIAIICNPPVKRIVEFFRWSSYHHRSQHAFHRHIIPDTAGRVSIGIAMPGKIQCVDKITATGSRMRTIKTDHVIVPARRIVSGNMPGVAIDINAHIDIF